jgi:acyl-coenzyme A thioesterase PaaI-like protein
VVQIGRTIAFAEAKLFDADGALVATATTSARVIETAKLDSTKM